MLKFQCSNQMLCVIVLMWYNLFTGGLNSVCRVSNGAAVCACQPNMIGSPPNCKPECVVSAECGLREACLNQKCVDPCIGTCGSHTECQVINHNPICSCAPGYTGDPFSACYRQIDETPKQPQNPCIPTPCGPNSECKVINESPACSCLPTYLGTPPNCRPECTINPECPANRACINQRCVDPCEGSCGSNTQCTVINHTPSCRCNDQYTGDPFRGCTPVQGKYHFSFDFCNIAEMPFIKQHNETWKFGKCQNLKPILQNTKKQLFKPNIYLY